MTQPITAVSIAPLVSGPTGLGRTRAVPGPGASFAATLNKALEHVSQAQATAHAAARSEVMGAPGASLETALVASMRAHIDWTAAVAVRNGVVSAYSTVMNMPV